MRGPGAIGWRPYCPMFEAFIGLVSWDSRVTQPIRWTSAAGDVSKRRAGSNVSNARDAHQGSETWRVRARGFTNVSRQRAFNRRTHEHQAHLPLV